MDTTLAANGPLDFQYFYHIGMDDFKRTIDFSTSAFTVVSGSNYAIGLKFDLLRMLNNVDMRTENITYNEQHAACNEKLHQDNWQGVSELE